MSIIHDALKKVETSRQDKPVSQTLKTGTPLKPVQPGRRRGRFPYALAGLLLLVLLVSAAVLRARGKSGSAQAFETPKEISRLTVNGIFFSDTMGYAIVNNEVVQAGDTCGGVRIKAIEPGAVVVQDRGSEYTLKTGN